MKILVKVKAGAREEKTEKIGDGEFKVVVKEPAKEGRANKKFLRFTDNIPTFCRMLECCGMPDLPGEMV